MKKNKIKTTYKKNKIENYNNNKQTNFIIIIIYFYLFFGTINHKLIKYMYKQSYVAS